MRRPWHKKKKISPKLPSTHRTISFFVPPWSTILRDRSIPISYSAATPSSSHSWARLFLSSLALVSLHIYSTEFFQVYSTADAASGCWLARGGGEKRKGIFLLFLIYLTREFHPRHGSWRVTRLFLFTQVRISFKGEEKKRAGIIYTRTHYSWHCPARAAESTGMKKWSHDPWWVKSFQWMFIILIRIFFLTCQISQNFIRCS